MKTEPKQAGKRQELPLAKQLVGNEAGSPPAEVSCCLLRSEIPSNPASPSPTQRSHSYFWVCVHPTPPLPSSRPDLLLCDAEGVLLDGVPVCPGTARGLDAAHQPVLALLQPQADVLQLRQVRPGNGLILVLCRSESHTKEQLKHHWAISVPNRTCWDPQSLVLTPGSLLRWLIK